MGDKACHKGRNNSPELGRQHFYFNQNWCHHFWKFQKLQRCLKYFCKEIGNEIFVNSWRCQLVMYSPIYTFRVLVRRHLRNDLPELGRQWLSHPAWAL